MEVNEKLVKLHGVLVGYIYSILKTKASISHEELATRCNISISTIRRTIYYMIEHDLIISLNSTGKKNTYKVKPLDGDQSETQPKKEPKQAYGEEGIVMLTPTEYKKLVKEFSEKKVKEYIKRMEEEYHRSGKIYHDCYFMLRKWMVEDKNRPSSRGNRKKKGGHLKEQEMKNIDQYLAVVNLFTVDSEEEKQKRLDYYMKKGDEE